MYDVASYVAMLADRGRVEAYLAAMRAVIRPGDVVLELGTGFGFFAVHAAKLGAAHVWALEPADAVALGPSIAELNGVADRITFVQALGTQFSLEKKADVLIEDMRGVSPLHGARLSALLDARDRLLAPAGRIVPVRDLLLLAPGETPVTPAHLSPTAASAPHGIEIGPALERARGAWRRLRSGEGVPLAPLREWAAVEFATFTSPDLAGGAEWAVERDGTLSGFVAAFEAQLAPGVSFTTGPGSGDSIYDSGWFPLASPIPVLQGDRVSCRMRAKFDGADYVMAWDTEVTRSIGTAPPERRRDSTLLSRIRSPERLQRRDARHRPALGAEARLVAEALALADGERTLGAIAAALRAAHPARFLSEGEALRWAGERLAALDEEPAP